MLVVSRLFPRPYPVTSSSHRHTVLDYIKCTYPLVSLLRCPYLSPPTLYPELYYYVNMLGSY